MTKFSIVVPAYNVEKYITECLLSIINQSYHNLEIIVVNDGSTDNTYSIIKDFQKRDSRIILVNQINLGLSNARNNGASVAKGEWLYFVDSDDFLHPQTFEIINNLLASNDSFDIISFDYYKFYENHFSFEKAKTKENKKYIDNNTIKPYNPVEYICSQGLYKVYVWRTIIKKGFWDQLSFGFIANYHYEDSEFMHKIILLCKNIGHIDQIFYYYRQRKSSFTYTKMNTHKLESAFIIIKTLSTFYEIMPFNIKEKKCFSTIISPELLRGVSLYNDYYKHFKQYPSLNWNHALFHLSQSFSLKHRIMYYMIKTNRDLASFILKMRYQSVNIFHRLKLKTMDLVTRLKFF